MNQPQPAKTVVQTKRFHSFRRTAYPYPLIPVALACIFCGFGFEGGGFSVLAVLCYVGASAVLTLHTGLEIDTEQQLQRFYISYVGVKIGGWQPLRNYDRITVRLCRRKANNWATWKDVKADFYQIYLFTGVQAEATLVFETNLPDTANEVAHRLSLTFPAAEIVHD